MKTKRRLARRSVIVRDRGRTVHQHLSVDDFRELPLRKLEARRIARKLGHDLKKWHKRPNDPCGRQNAFCATCNLVAVVAVEPDERMPGAYTYGSALTRECRGRV